jgi:uncharacterized protein YkwD
MVRWINDERTDPAHNLNALSINGALGYTARMHLRDMACNNLFSHRGSDGRRVVEQVGDMGSTYAGRPVADNIWAQTDLDAEGAFRGWMRSTYGHRENILDARWNELGVSCVEVTPHNVYVDADGDPNNYAYYWSAIFIDR